MSLFFVRRSLIAAAAAVLFTPAAHAVPERIAQSSAEALSRLSANAGGKLANSRIADQHYVMVRAAKGATLLADGGSGSPEERARYFLSLHGAVNGVSNPPGQLKTKRVSKGASGSSHVHLDQIQAGIPVFGASSVGHMNASGITGVSGVVGTDAVNLRAQVIF